MATIYELIDLRSFSNLWFWIALAVTWSSASHWVLGVPNDLLERARRTGGDSLTDLQDLVRVNVNRILHTADSAGIVMTAVGSFLLTTLVLLGFVYRVEFAQAVFLLAFPLTLVWLLSLRTARGIRADVPDAQELFLRLRRLRVTVQAIGLLSILITSLWGMYTNLTLGVLGG